MSLAFLLGLVDHCWNEWLEMPGMTSLMSVLAKCCEVCFESILSQEKPIYIFMLIKKFIEAPDD